MSRENKQIVQKREFIERFVDACGSSEPAEIQRLLNIPYQSAKNYLSGRIPQSDKLILIAMRTSCSIDWLLTGRGKKFADALVSQDTTLPTGQMEAFVRRICVEVINEVSGSGNAAQPKVVILQSSELMSEKVMDETKALTGRQP
ncbi:MAG: helix-turn-helix domain-containing protein [Pyrinomonadaceae bacterium]